MENEDCILIHDWMIKKLGLKGNSLFIYALIYNVSQASHSEFIGSIAYIGQFLNISKHTVRNALNYLCKRNLIIRDVVYINNIRGYKYAHNEKEIKRYGEED